LLAMVLPDAPFSDRAFIYRAMSFRDSEVSVSSPSTGAMSFVRSVR
jgi:hypothetical protein